MGAKPPASRRDRIDDSIPEAASRWLARRDRGLTAMEAAELRRWEAADPRHAAELARLEASWRGFDLAKAAPELVAMAGELDRATARRTPARERKWRSLLVAAAATVTLVAGLTWWQLAIPGGGSRTAATPSYQVLPSAARRLVLEDGSVAEARGDAEVRAEFTAAERRVVLVRGEALFTVTKDPARPFVVRAGGAAVRAVGTAFNVRLEAGQVEVLVTEGKVQVADAAPAASTVPPPPQLVVAGQRAMVVPNETSGVPARVEVSATAPAEVEQALAWQGTRLVFNRTPLGEAVEAFNRHAAATTGVRVAIGDESLRTRRLGGTFRATNVEGFIRLLEMSVEVRAERRGGQIVLLPVR